MIYSGDTAQIVITVTDSVTGAAVNLSGASMTWKLAPTVTGTASLTLTSADGDIAVSGASNNIATVTIAAGDTAALSGTYYHELQAIDGSSNVYTLYQGRIAILPDMVTA